MIRRSWVVPVLLLATTIACKGKGKASDKQPAPPPPPAGSGSGAGTGSGSAPGSAAPADPLAITLPAGAGYRIDDHATVVVLRDGKLARITGTGAAPDAGGRLVLPRGEPIELAALAKTPHPADCPPSMVWCDVIVVIADRVTPARDLESIAAGLAGRCWGFGTTAAGRLAVQLPAPCPPLAPAKKDASDELVQLGVWAEQQTVVVGVSRVNDFNSLDKRSELAGVLHDQHHSTFFTDRVDLAIAVEAGLALGDVVELLDIAHDAGFTAAHWVPAAKLPVEIENKTGSDPELAASLPEPPVKPPPIVDGLGIACTVRGGDAGDVESSLRAEALGLKICLGDPGSLPDAELVLYFDLEGNAVNLDDSSCVGKQLKAARFPRGVQAAACRLLSGPRGH